MQVLLTLRESGLPACATDMLGSGPVGSGEAPSCHLAAAQPTGSQSPSCSPPGEAGLKVTLFSGQICIIGEGKPLVPTHVVQFPSGKTGSGAHLAVSPDTLVPRGSQREHSREFFSPKTRWKTAAWVWGLLWPQKHLSVYSPSVVSSSIL